jgi:hypothetical protein
VLSCAASPFWPSPRVRKEVLFHSSTHAPLQMSSSSSKESSTVRSLFTVLSSLLSVLSFLCTMFLQPFWPSPRGTKEVLFHSSTHAHLQMSSSSSKESSTVRSLFTVLSSLLCVLSFLCTMFLSLFLFFPLFSFPLLLSFCVRVCWCLCVYIYMCM